LCPSNLTGEICIVFIQAPIPSETNIAPYSSASSHEQSETKKDKELEAIKTGSHWIYQEPPRSVI
jgi:hypothetical protein